MSQIIRRGTKWMKDYHRKNKAFLQSSILKKPAELVVEEASCIDGQVCFWVLLVMVIGSYLMPWHIITKTDTVGISPCLDKSGRLDKQMLKCKHRTCIEMNTQVITTVEKNQLKLLPKQPAADAYSVHILYIPLYTVRWGRLINENTRLE